MRGVDVKALSEREGDGIIIEGSISWRIVGLNGRMSETSKEFLNIPNALYASNWWAKCRAIPTVTKSTKDVEGSNMANSHTKSLDRHWTMVLSENLEDANKGAPTHSWSPPIRLQWTAHRTWNIPKLQSAILVSHRLSYCKGVIGKKYLVGTQLLHCEHIFNCQIKSFEMSL
jgi:hypothetical protein